MASSQSMETGDFRRKMALFPCMFNMPCFDHMPRERLRNRKASLLIDLENGAEGREEESKMRNLLTFVFYHLGLYNRASEMNEMVLMETNYKSLVALSNSVYLEWLRSARVSHHLNLLDDLKEKPNFEEMVLEAKAEQAYCLGKLGNKYNLISAIELYEEVLSCKENDKWRYLLGLAYRRLSVMHDIEKYSRNKLTASMCSEKADKCFQQLSESSDKSLKAIAFANIALNLSSDRRKYFSKKTDIVSLVRKAVQTDENRETCMIGGKALLYYDITFAVSLLEKAVEKRPQHSVSHHQLGKAYMRQWNGRGPSQIREKGHKHLRLAYELSGKLNYYPLLDLTRSFQKMRDYVNAEKEAMNVLTLRATTGNDALEQLISSHEAIYEASKSPRGQRHLWLSKLAAVAVVKDESSDEELHALWSKIFEIRMRHADIKLKINADRMCESVHKNQADMLVCQTISAFVRDGCIDDVDAVASKARDISRSSENEEALLFLEFVSLRPGMDTSRLRDVHLQFLASQAKVCLQDHLSISSHFFKHLFELSLSPCDHLHDDDDIEVDFDVSIKIDIVILFNDSIQNASSLSVNTAYGLEDAISTLFGLKVAFNPMVDVGEDSGQGQDIGLIHFINKHQIDVILVMFEGDGAETQDLLKKIVPFVEENVEGHKPSVLLMQSDDQPSLYLPDKLKMLPCLSLGQEFPNLFCQKEAHDQADKSVYLREVFQAYFQGNIDNVIKLFDHLTRRHNVK